MLSPMVMRLLSSPIIALSVLLARPQEESTKLTYLPDGATLMASAFSPSGEMAAIAFQRNGEFRIRCGTWESKPSRLPMLPVVREGGRLVFYGLAGTERKFHVFRNDEALFEVPSNMESWVVPGTVSEDGTVIANAVYNKISERGAIAVNGKPGKYFHGRIFSPVLSRDGRTIAAAIETPEGHGILLNEVIGPLYDWVTQPVLSADGRTLAYGAQKGDGWLISHRERLHPCKEEPLGVFVSADGERFGYWRKVTGAGGVKLQQVVVEEVEGPLMKEIFEPVLDRTERQALYHAIEPTGRHVIVVGKKIVPADGIRSNPVYLSGGRVGYGVEKDNAVWWKVIQLSW
jgi:hypothetical protein